MTIISNKNTNNNHIIISIDDILNAARGCTLAIATHNANAVTTNRTTTVNNNQAVSKQAS